MFKGSKHLSKGFELLYKGSKHMFRGFEHKLSAEGKEKFHKGEKEKI